MSRRGFWLLLVPAVLVPIVYAAALRRDLRSAHNRQATAAGARSSSRLETENAGLVRLIQDTRSVEDRILKKLGELDAARAKTLSGLEQRLGVRLEALEGRVAGAEAAKGLPPSGVTTLDELKAAQTALTGQLAAVAKVPAELEALRGQLVAVAKLQTDLTAVQTKLAALETRAPAIPADLTAKLAALEELPAALAAVQTKLAALEAKAPAIPADLTAKLAALEKLPADLAAVQTKLAALETKAPAIPADLTAKLAALEKLPADVAAVKTEVAAVAKLQADLTAAQTKLAAIDKLTADLAATRTALDELTTKAAALDGLAALGVEVKKISDAVKALDLRTQAGAASVAALGAEIQQARDEAKAADSVRGGEIAALRRAIDGPSRPVAGERPSGPVVAVVGAVNAVEQMVVLKVSRPADAVVGARVELWRGTRRVAVLRLFKPLGEYFGARIEWTAPGEVVQTGDEAHLAGGATAGGGTIGGPAKTPTTSKDLSGLGSERAVPPPP